MGTKCSGVYAKDFRNGVDGNDEGGGEVSRAFYRFPEQVSKTILAFISCAVSRTTFCECVTNRFCSPRKATTNRLSGSGLFNLYLVKFNGF